jgi:CBS domain-containing protein
VIPDTPIRDAVSLFEKEEVDILPVLDAGKLVGVVGRGDLVHLLVTGDDLIE